MTSNLLTLTSRWCQHDAHGHHPLHREPPPGPGRRRGGRRPRDPTGRGAPLLRARPGRPAGADGGRLAGGRRDHRRDAVGQRRRPAQRPRASTSCCRARPAPAPTPPAPPTAEEAEDEGNVARITLRLPGSVKPGPRSLAARSGHSLNTWLVNVVRAATRENAINVDIDLSSIPFFGDKDPSAEKERPPPHDRLDLTTGPPRPPEHPRDQRTRWPRGRAHPGAET